MRTYQKIGFVGLGVMGIGMANNLLKAGYELVVYHIYPARVELLSDPSKATVVAKNSEIFEQTDTVILMLPNSPHVESAIFGEGGLLESRAGNQISDYNLLNFLARSTGMARTPYMELLADFYHHVPFYNNRLLLPLSQEDAFFPRAMEQITYDRVLGEGWSS